MIRNQYKEKYSKEIEIEEAQRIFRSLTGKRKNATFKEILENEQELSIEVYLLYLLLGIEQNKIQT